MKKCILLLLSVISFGFIFAQETRKAAYLSIYENVNAIEDDDEKASAQWFVNTYGGDFLAVSALATADLSQYGVIMIHVDDEFFPEPYEELLTSDVLSLLGNYYKGGGNLLLCIHGSHMLYELGRIDIIPDVMSTGAAKENTDKWYVSPTHGTFSATSVPHDRSGDKIYAGLVSEPNIRDNGIEYVQFPLLDATMKEDHNCFWTMDTEAGLANDDEQKLTSFESTYNVDVLGTWSHVQDYFGAAIARWKPQGDYQGTAITVGVAAYEWGPNGTTNTYQSNIEKLTKNALDELRGTITNGVDAVLRADVQLNIINNTLYVENMEEMVSADLYSANGALVNSFKSSQLVAGIDISALSKGIYIITLKNNSGNVIGSRKFIK